MALVTTITGFHDSANCNAPNVISVANFSPVGALAPSSNYGLSTVDLGAPGTNIWSTFPGYRIARMTGTSMAAPHVSGVAALVLSRKPNLDPYELRLRLMETTLPLPASQGKLVSPGMVRADAALQNIRSRDLNVDFTQLKFSASKSGRNLQLNLQAKLHDASRRISKVWVAISGSKPNMQLTLSKKSNSAALRTYRVTKKKRYSSSKVKLSSLKSTFYVRLTDGKLVRSVEANPARPRAQTGEEVCLTFRSEDAIALPPDTSDGG